MSRIINPILLFTLILFLNTKSNAQLELPRVSQKASVTQTIGLTDIIITYSRPNVKGRVIWSDLVPYNQVWRTGADEATTISFGENVQINDYKLPAGKYALFTIPAKDEWTIIINYVSKQWGAFNYDSTKDALRFKIKQIENRFVESLTIYFSDVTTSSAKVNITWEKIKISFNIKIDTDSLAYKNIKKAIAEIKPDDWVVYAASANYAADNNLHIEEAMDWIEKSISIKETYYNYFVKAKLLCRNGQNKEALKLIKKTRELGKNDKEFKTFVQQVDKLERELKEKK
jgi:tetratricopeptide (TPR) repeat protein